MGLRTACPRWSDTTNFPRMAHAEGADREGFAGPYLSPVDAAPSPPSTAGASMMGVPSVLKRWIPALARISTSDRCAQPARIGSEIREGALLEPRLSPS